MNRLAAMLKEALAANTIGGIIGVAAFSLIFVFGWGTQQAQQALIVISAVAAMLILLTQRSRRTIQTSAPSTISSPLGSRSC